MAIQNGGEIVVYLLAAAQAVGVGFVFASASSSKHRSTLYAAGLLFVGAAVATGFMLGTSAPWAGPIFAVVASVTSVLAAATSLGSDPAMREESFPQRIVYALSRRPRHDRRDENAS